MQKCKPEVTSENMSALLVLSEKTPTLQALGVQKCKPEVTSEKTSTPKEKSLLLLFLLEKTPFL